MQQHSNDPAALEAVAQQAMTDLLVAESDTGLDMLPGFVAQAAGLKERFDALRGQQSQTAQRAVEAWDTCIAYLCDALGLSGAPGAAPEGYLFRVGELDAAKRYVVPLPDVEPGTYMICRAPEAAKSLGKLDLLCTQTGARAGQAAEQQGEVE